MKVFSHFNDGKNYAGNVSLSFMSVFKGTFISLVVSVLGASIAGLVFYFFSVSEKIIPWISTGVLSISVFIGGVWAAYSASNRGIYHGLIVGILFFIISWLLGLLFFPGTIVLLCSLQKLVLTGMAGALGGIIGVGSS
ncbi:MAG: TIGR04086 family membrane protein [Clostridiales bacterium]|nr:TIGR04086 family membrane protein [Clostridiales bacterium]MCF8021982.1 TIGR04086 family membrane protein [Clostridiales bacterium]